MRILVALPLLLLGACQVSKDNQNNTVSVTYNEEVAANAAADVGNTAENIAHDIGNDVKNTGDKLQNKVGNDDHNSQANATENKSH
jgi:hypothetical protein